MDDPYRRASLRRTWIRRLWLTFLILPPAAIMAVFIFLPMASALWYSAYEWDGLVKGEFAGLKNFRKVLLG